MIEAFIFPNGLFSRLHSAFAAFFYGIFFFPLDILWTAPPIMQL